MKNYKWAYNAENKALMIWPVDSMNASACPQHGDILDKDEYATLYQGRISVSHGLIESFTIYDDRPYRDRTEQGAREAAEAVKDWSAWN